MDVEKRKIYADYPILNDYIYLQTINLFLTVIYRKKYKQALKTYPTNLPDLTGYARLNLT